MPTRRALLAGFVASAAAPLAAAAQAGKVYRIGVLGKENNPPWDGFRQGLRDLGYVDGRNVSMDWRWSEGKPHRLPGLAAEVVALEPDVIVASGTQAIRAAKRATSPIPIVMTTSSYPDKIGLVDSLSAHEVRADHQPEDREALNLTILPTLLLRADQVIE